MFRSLFLSFALFCGLLSLLAGSNAVAQTAATAPWTFTVRSGDVVYFVVGTPARIERYDLAGEQWLTPTSLATTAALTAFHVDADAIYYATDREVMKRAMDGSSETPVYNSPATVSGILTDSSYIFIFNSGYSNNRIDSVRKSDNQFVATWTGTYSLGTGFSISPGQRRIYGINNQTTAFSTIELAYNANGTFGTTTEIWGDGNFGTRYRTWPSPDERKLIRSTGVVYSVPGLAVRGSLAGNADDVAFHGNDVAIVLRGSKLVAFDNTLLEAGATTLATTAFGIAVRSGQIYAFGSGTNTAGIAVTKVAVSSLTAAQPGAAIDPALISYVPDDVLQAEDGTLLMLSKKLQSIFRWSPSTSSYTASYPLLGSPTSFTYSATLRRIYTAYSSGALYQIKLDEGATAEVPFYNLPSSPGPLLALDDLILAGTGYSYYDYSLIDRNGVKKTTPNLYGYATIAMWSSGQRRLYYSDSSTLKYTPVDTNGGFGTAISGPYTGSNYPQFPLRLSTDGGSILGVNGYVYRTSDLTYIGSLSNAFIDSVSRAGTWATIRAAGTETQLQLWASSYFLDRGFTMPGVPLRIFTLSDGRLAVLSTSAGDLSGGYSSLRNDGRLIFSLVDPTGSGTVNSSPNITSEPVAQTVYRGRAAAFSVVSSGGSLTYQWRRNGTNVSGATNATLSFTSAQDADAGSYSVLVTNPYGSALSKTAALDVQSPPPSPVIATQPASAFGLLGGSASFSVSATGVGLTYQWRRAATAISGATSNSLSISGLTAGDFTTYDVIVTNPGGSVTSQTATLTAATPPTIVTQPTGQPTSLGGTATFSVTASGAPAPAYRWLRAASGTSTFVALSTTSTYSGVFTKTLTVTGATLAMSGDRFLCVVGNGYFADVTSNAATLTVSAAPVFTSNSSTTFIAGISNSFIIQATGTPAPQFTAVDLPTWAALNPTTGVLSGTPPSTTGSPFSILITAANGTLPNASQLFSLNVQSTVGAPTITTQPFNRSVGIGASVTFSVVAAGADPLTYQWRKDGVAITSATQASFTIAPTALTDAGRYTVVVSNPAGSVTSNPVTLSVVPAGVVAVHTPASAGYLPGQQITITNTLTYSGSATALGWQVLLPEGWTFVSASGAQGGVKPAPNATSLLEWAWTEVPASPLTFSYTLNVPAGVSGDQALSALVSLRLDGPEIKLLALPDPLVLRRLSAHTADTDGDGKISLFELLRVIQLYNTRSNTVRSGAYRVDPAGEDGFAPDFTRSGTATLPSYCSADSNRDGCINLTELTRVIELYNYRSGSTRTGAYHPQANTEDGFEPGP